MPELPEVETVLQSLLRYDLTNSPIVKIEIKKEYHIKEIGIDCFINSLLGKSINDIKRKGKWLFFFLEKLVLIGHLRMTGKFFFVENKKQEANIIFHFLNGKKLFFCDPRGFGVFYLQKIDSFHNLTPFKRIGPDIIQEKIDPSYLYFFFKKLKITVKEALLEQKIMSGIGNIYASEILFACKINPLRLTNEINYKEIEKIIFFSRNILEESIKLGGTSIIDFISPEEKKGLFKNKLNVYMRKNKECYLCRSLIKEIKLNRRTTFFCPSCQKK